MIPVDKLVEHDPENGKYGDCMRACIASLLEMETEDVPHFYETGKFEDYDFKLTEFLKSKNIKIVYTSHEGCNFGNKTIYHLIFGTNHCGILHACVAKNGVLVHDPNPNRNGLKEVDSFGFFVHYTDAEYKNLSNYTLWGVEIDDEF